MLKETTPKTHKRKLLLLVAVMIAPIAFSYMLFYWGSPSGSVNYGELIEFKKALPNVALRQTNGEAFNISQLRGKWIMLVVDSGECGEPCRKKLYHMRQVRLMQNKKMDRIERVWLIDDDKIPETVIKEDFKGTIFISAQKNKLLKEIPAKVSRHDHIYIIDPLGNLMMRFPKDIDPAKIAKDIKRLLKVSRIG
jgi:cytochrome oxidase Cu insertion factor (SCO1/SenC/PrrC family)